MKRLLAFALIVAGLTIPIYAQRSISRGSFSGRPAQPFRGGLNASVPSRLAGLPRYTGSRTFSLTNGVQRSGIGNFSAHPTYADARRSRRPHQSFYGAGVTYVVPGGIGPYFLAYPDAVGYDDSSASPNYAAEQYDALPAEQGEPATSGPYQSLADLSHPSSTPDSEEAVTLVFKDGRPPEQIHNYVLTRTTLYVRDQGHRDVPIDQLDLVATAKVNHDAGVDFQLPGASK